jgi:hypothetical protein
MEEKLFGFTFGDDAKVHSLNGNAVPEGVLHVAPPLCGERNRGLSEQAVATVEAAYKFAEDLRDA